MDRSVATVPTFDSLDPATGELLATLPAAQPEDIDAAVAAARAAQPAWAAVDPTRRTKLLVALAQAIEAHADELAELESRDVGKPIAEARNRDLKFAAQTWLYYTG